MAETNIKANYLCKILLIICIAVCFPFYISAEENTEPGLFSRKISEIFHPKKAAYIKLAKILTKSQLENKSKSDNKDISDIVSYYNSLIMDLKHIEYDDTDIKYIRDESIAGIEEMINRLRMIQQLQQIDNTNGDLFIGLTKFGLGIYTGSLTMTLGSISDILNNAEKSSAPVQPEIYKYLVGLQRFQDAKRLLPKVAKTLSDDPRTNEELVDIDITEPWGVSAFTYFKI